MIIAGGRGSIYSQIIMEHDKTKDSMIEIANMTESKSYIATSVVNYDDFAQWCEYKNLLYLNIF